jgi:hypothetical protein
VKNNKENRENAGKFQGKFEKGNKLKLKKLRKEKRRKMDEDCAL